MALVRNNVVVRGLSGSLGKQVVIKMDKAQRTIMGNHPTYPEGRVFTAAQQAQQQKFSEAAVYAKGAKALPVYVEKAEGTPMYPYNVAMADFLRPPEVKTVDLSAWTGQAGQTISIQADDDVEVKQVSVDIMDASNAVLEHGLASQQPGGWWTYVTTTTPVGASKVSVMAEDLPGHKANLVKTP